MRWSVSDLRSQVEANRNSKMVYKHRAQKWARRFNALRQDMKLYQELVHRLNLQPEQPKVVVTQLGEMEKRLKNYDLITTREDDRMLPGRRRSKCPAVADPPPGPDMD